MEHSEIKQKIPNKRNYTNTRVINNTLLDEQFITDEIREENLGILNFPTVKQKW